MAVYRLKLVIALALCCLAASPAPSRAGEILINTAGYDYNAPVTTLKELRFRRVVKQAYDFSCGSAAVATLLTYHYNRPILEQTVLKAMFEVGDKDKIKKEGFSMLDMKKYLESLGYRVEGYQVSLDKVAQVGIPGIVLIKTKGYLHFVVLKGVRGGQVLLGDSALGTKFMPRERFLEVWNGIFLAIITGTRQAKNEFNLDQDWEGQVAAPLGRAMTRESLATLTLLMPGRNNF
jgi:predicted double-glycine peptidase